MWFVMDDMARGSIFVLVCNHHHDSLKAIIEAEAVLLNSLKYLVESTYRFPEIVYILYLVSLFYVVFIYI